jgi:inosose dehydratase
MKYGIQTYTWQMQYEKYKDSLEHILGVIVQGKQQGIEMEVCMLGAYREHPVELRALLQSKNIELAALCLVCDWALPQETIEESREADFAIDFVKAFPGAILQLCQMPGKDRENLEIRQKNALSCLHAVARRAQVQGIKSAFHPNSPPSSIWRIESDYDILLRNMDPKVLSFCPDVGHIAKGGMDPLKLFRENIDLIAHVHYKDMSKEGVWESMGRGCLPFVELSQFLEESGYHGWIMVEEESESALTDPDKVTLDNCSYIDNILKVRK